MLLSLNTRITAFLTYLELPGTVKMTVCPIKKEMSNNFSFTLSCKYFLNFCSMPSNYLNVYRCEFGAL